MTAIQTSLPAAVTPAQSAGSRWWIWPAIIVGFLLSQIVLSFASLYFALSDPASAVEPDYYAKGVSYDRQLVQRRMLEALGWKPTLTISQHDSASPHRLLQLRLTDKTGAPVQNVAVRVVAFAHAHAIDRRSVELTAVDGASGLYAAQLPTPLAGIWEFRFTINQGPQTISWSTQEFLAP